MSMTNGNASADGFNYEITLEVMTMKNRIMAAIDAHREEIFACGAYILRHPELGFREEKTSAYVKAEFQKLGIP